MENGKLCGFERLTGPHVAAAVTRASAPRTWAAVAGHHCHHLGWLLLDHRDLHELLLSHNVCITAEQLINQSINSNLFAQC